MAGGLGVAGGASLARGSTPDEAADVSGEAQQK
jgi:hypothetical protein